MYLKEGKAKFIESWGKLGSSWGISRTMAQLHALLMVSPRPMCADHIMEALCISRGNANLNLRALIDWGLVHKVLKPGDRKEYFEAEKEMMVIFKQIIRMRKKKELDPMIKVLEDISCVKSECEDSKEFCKMICDLKTYTQKADATFESLLNSEPSWIYKAFFKMMQ
jgi:DNA-binding transcriptional regulator GbsR (MarR family)